MLYSLILCNIILIVLYRIIYITVIKYNPLRHNWSNLNLSNHHQSEPMTHNFVVFLYLSPLGSIPFSDESRFEPSMALTRIPVNP